MDTTSLFKYFPELSDKQKEQYNQLKDLYLDWNSKINVISRKDMEHFYEHHVLHSLAIAKYYELLPGMKVMDLGTGGGFPGIPLAIMFPQTEFYLIDGTGKKIKVVNAVKDAIGLENVVAEQKRAEEVKDKFDVITGRAVMTLPEIANLAGNKLRIRGDVEVGALGRFLIVTDVIGQSVLEFASSDVLVERHGHSLLGDHGHAQGKQCD